MTKLPHTSRFWLGAVLWAAAFCAAAAPQEASTAQALLAAHHRMAESLARSPFGRPLLLDSAETPDGLTGDIYAVVDRPLADIAGALGTSARWCEMLLLHINNRRCSVAKAPSGADVLTLSVVRRYDKPVDSAFELPFVYRVVDTGNSHLAMDLSAVEGPLGTRAYRVMLEAVALDERRSFVHFRYSYEHNTMARLATQAYLATFGSHKVGFTVLGQGSDREPEHIRGTRGLVERNAMRYFLTLDAYLAAPGAGQGEQRRNAWFQSIEKYPVQLHEVDLATYLTLKREDRQRDGTGD
ncbi:hypothetical protein [Variovorax sp. PAMC 28711]|uniref:hypothetical protein n=1 Tax=Variovorax sp. PAMC 28711 TaxID=1795631 RepID=UPI00078BF6BC|nr:hypothetical protein [Variovorax sp. PAMC 28711]AMM23038.1 hypothetical protein AX767_00565 [Variovorax sp. PAMC 28711]